MCPLIAPVAVHSVRINHQIELEANALQGITKLEGALEMHVVISRSVCEFKHRILSFRTTKTRLDLIEIGYDSGLCIALRISLWRIHKPFSIMRVVQSPVINTATCDTAAEMFRMAENQHCSRGSAERKALYAYA